ncbi:MAG: homocysteine S-methyltransferase family protein [Candidatus Saccharicenans sp.]|nr:homocysteine S-methyltransferase family protein [Candidatus Saccharicenans sp.]
MIDIRSLAEKKIFLLDGAMGTELFRTGLPPGHCPEAWNLEQPEKVAAIHRSYFEAGSKAVLTNSFGGNAVKLTKYELQEKTYELNFQAAKIARSVCPPGCYVGGSIGPTGKFLQPAGELTEDRLYEAFRPQAEGLAAGGVDFFLIETQYDLREALAALKAVRDVSPLPVWVTMTFNLTKRGYFTIMGVSPEVFVRAMEENAVEALGTNCTLSPADMIELIKQMRRLTSKPLIAQPNAGQPRLGEDGSTYYDQGPEEFARPLAELIEAGAMIVGGCCGTLPAHIEKMAEIVGSYSDKIG